MLETPPAHKPAPPAGGASEPLLDVRGLNAFYGRAQVLFDLSFEVRRGEVVALMGRNGAGKTTTLKAIIGLVEARSQTLRFRNTDLRGLPTYRIARLGIGFVPEDRRIFTDLTVIENLEIGRRPPLHGRQPWSPERLFAIFPNLAEVRSRRASAISGGEQQMLTIARTLMGNPELVLLDEPSEGLAPVIVEEMAEAVIRMKEQGIAVLLCEQNLAFASAVADRAIVIEKGALRFAGTLDELTESDAARQAYLSM
jgi:branched-chain amino acid transport system ATP-binding protein